MNIQELFSIYKEHPVISTDSRMIDKGCLFFALKGENFNGNRYAESALEKGASFAIIDEEIYKKDQRFILVPDVLESLQNLANLYRKQFKIPFIGITGSNGKTTTKELIAKVLSEKYSTHYTKGNLNNHIGVPLTLLTMPEDSEIAVIEMGANHQGEIGRLCEIAEPDYGLITNIGKAHLEGFGGFEGVKKGKSELYKFIKKCNGKIFINGKDDILIDLSQGNNMIYYEDASLIELNPFVKLQWKGYTIQSKLIGTYNLTNILAAISIGQYFGVEDQSIISAIESYEPKNNRSQILKTKRNDIILDAYNANPTSMKSALKAFAKMPGDNKICILGDMLELGIEAENEHMQIKQLVQDLGLSKVVYVGPVFKSIARKVDNAFLLNEEAKVYLKDSKISQHQILIKGSRGIKLEILTEVL
jgi:UDP-N-acetylmuramoyl-tripeptide--D-alanyl-D-alanine ligase